MGDETHNLRTVDLEVREQLNGSEKNWVIGRLVARQGVSGALWANAQPRLRIEYDADVVSGLELFDVIESFGLHARPYRPARVATAA
jgi:hypothetical protein